MDPDIKVVGLRELITDLKVLDDAALTDELKAAHREGAEIVAGAARPLVPRRSGALLGTVRASATVRGGRVAAGKAKVPYVKPIHFGWPARGIAPTPFLYDALDARRAAVVDAFADRVETLTDKIGR